MFTTAHTCTHRPSRRTRRLAGAIAAATLLVACGGDDGETGSADLADGLASAAVCNGEPSDVSPASTEPFAGFSYLTDGDGWTVGWNEVFGEQRAVVGDDATSILCVTVTESTESERCDYEQDGESFTLVMVSASYDIELRNADTAEVIASDSFSVEAEECPFVVSWTPGEGEDISYPRPSEEQIESSIGPFLG